MSMGLAHKFWRGYGEDMGKIYAIITEFSQADEVPMAFSLF
jgi:hypothetical protein